MRPSVILPDWELGEFETAEKLQAEIDRIKAGRFFLVKIAGNGDVWRCRNCGGKHRYFTLLCVEQPFSGLTDGLHAYWRTVGVHAAKDLLPPTERRRLEQIERLVLGDLPDLSVSHPLLARTVGTGLRDIDVGAFTFTATDETPASLALGRLEPISRAAARQLVERINAKGLKPPLMVPGLYPAGR